MRNLLYFSSLLIILTSCHSLEKRWAKSQKFQADKIVLIGVKEVNLGSFQKIPAGKFMMGSPSNEWRRWDNENQQPVEITKPFKIMATEVTQRQWFQMMGNNPSKFKTAEDCDGHEIVNKVKLCPKNPVENVSWDDAQKFISKLNVSIGLKGCRGMPHDPKGCYRLPTEAEWEYSARAGTKTTFFFGTNPLDAVKYAWSYQDAGDKTHPVGMKAPNPNGLHDMIGNVWEWVQDEYKLKLPGRKDPLARTLAGSQDQDRVLRGGCYCCGIDNMRSARRYSDSPKDKTSFIGFRLVRNI